MANELSPTPSAGALGVRVLRASALCAVLGYSGASQAVKEPTNVHLFPKRVAVVDTQERLAEIRPKLWQHVIKAKTPWISASSARILLGVSNHALEQLHGQGLLEARYDKGELQLSRVDVLAIAGQTGKLPGAWGEMPWSLRRETAIPRIRNRALTAWQRVQEAWRARKLARARNTHLTGERKAELQHAMIRREAALDDLKQWVAERWSAHRVARARRTHMTSERKAQLQHAMIRRDARLDGLKEWFAKRWSTVATRWQAHRVAKAQQTHVTAGEAAAALGPVTALPRDRWDAHSLLNPLIEARVLKFAAHEIPPEAGLRPFRRDNVAAARRFLTGAGQRHFRLGGLFRPPGASGSPRTPRRPGASGPARKPLAAAGGSR